MDTSINYWAVLVAALASMVIGSAWYGFVFGKYWRKLMGFTLESMKAMPLTQGQAMVGGLVTALLLAGTLAWLADSLLLLSASDALKMALSVWLGFAVPFTASSWLWEGKSFRLFVFNAVQWLISFAVMSVIVTLWR